LWWCEERRTIPMLSAQTRALMSAAPFPVETHLRIAFFAALGQVARTRTVSWPVVVVDSATMAWCWRPEVLGQLVAQGLPQVGSGEVGRTIFEASTDPPDVALVTANRLAHFSSTFPALFR